MVEKSCVKKHRHYYKTIIIDGRGWRHQRCKCGKHRALDESGKIVYEDK